MIKIKKQDKAKQVIKDWIEKKKFKPGDKFLPLVELEQKLDMTAKPIRIAIAELVKEGWLKTLNGVGTFVCHPNESKEKVMILASSLLFFTDITDTKEDAYLVEIFNGLLKELQLRNLEPVFCPLYNYGEPEKLIEKFKEEKPMGIIILSRLSLKYLQDLVKYIGFHRIVIATRQEVSLFNHLKVNTKKAFHEILDHLIEQGHKKIGFLNARGERLQNKYAERFNVYLDYIVQKQLVLDPSCIISGNGELGGYRSVMRLLSESKEVSAICSVSDSRAAGAAVAIDDLGLKLGADIAISGMGDHGVSKKKDITSISFSNEDYGAEAIKLLFEVCTNELTDVCKTVEAKAMIRASTQGYKKS